MADNTVMGSTDTLRTKDRTTYKTPATLIDVSDGVAAELLGLVPPDVPTLSSSGLTTVTTAYTAGDVLGAEFVFAAARASGRGVVITSAVLIDKAKVVQAVDAFVFDRASTPAADNAANSWADADAANCKGIIQFPAPTASALNGIAVANNNLPLVVKGNSSVNIYVVLVTRASHTFFGAATDLVLALGTEPA